MVAFEVLELCRASGRLGVTVTEAPVKKRPPTHSTLPLVAGQAVDRRKDSVNK